MKNTNNINIEVIAKQLLKKTEQQGLNWKPTSREDEYIVHLKSGAIVIWLGDEYEGDVIRDYKTIDISVYNAKSEHIYQEAFTDNDNRTTELYNILSNLHEQAKVCYFKNEVEETFEDILQELSTNNKLVA